MPSADHSNVRLSVVIPTHDTRSLALACLDKIFAAGSPSPEVVLLDDGSTDGTAEAVRERFPAVRVLCNERALGFTEAANRGLGAATGRLVVLLNSDTEVDAGAWQAVEAAFAANPSLGIVGAALRYPDGTPQWSGGGEPSHRWLFGLASGLPALLGRLPGVRALRPVRGASGEPVEWVTGAAMALRREVLERVGPLDPSFRLYGQDLDLCTRARAAGWWVAVAPSFRVLHHHGATIGRQAGAAGAANPEWLWRDLVRWGAKHRGPAWARRAAAALRAGATLRLAGRSLAGAFLLGTARNAWRRDSLAFRRAAAGVRDELRIVTSRPPGGPPPGADSGRGAGSAGGSGAGTHGTTGS